MLTEYILFFIIYSFFGWLYESLYYSLQFKKLVNTGFLHACFCPIYGVVCVGNIIFLGNVQSDARVFLISMLMVSATEYVVSWLLEKKFNRRWWDYSGLPFNINGRISLFSSLAFGFMSLFQMRVIHPIVVHILAPVNHSAMTMTVAVVMFVILFDFLHTLSGIKNSDNDRLWFVNEISPAMQSATQKFNQRTHSISEKCNMVYGHIKNLFDK